MSYHFEYKEQIEPYKWLLVKRIDDLQHILRNKNKILKENGLSYLPMLADDIYNSFLNIYTILPKNINISIHGLNELHNKLVNASYEDLIADDGYRGKMIALFNKYVSEVYELLNNIIKQLDELGLLFRRERIETGGEQ